MKAQVRFEFFNLFNKATSPRWQRPDGTSPGLGSTLNVGPAAKGKWDSLRL